MRKLLLVVEPVVTAASNQDVNSSSGVRKNNEYSSDRYRAVKGFANLKRSPDTRIKESFVALTPKVRFASGTVLFTLRARLHFIGQQINDHNLLFCMVWNNSFPNERLVGACFSNLVGLAECARADVKSFGSESCGRGLGQVRSEEHTSELQSRQYL